MTEPTVAVCVGFRPRNEHDQRVWDWCQRRWEAHFPYWHIFVADSLAEKYNRSEARNTAASMTDAEVLIFSNSDTTFYRADDMRAAVESAAAGTWALSANYVETSRGYCSVILHEDPADEIPDPLSSYDRQLPDSCAGPQIVRADQWRDVGRWDEAFTGWGWEDRSLMNALDALHAPHARIGTSVHLHHERTVLESPGANGAMRARWARLYRAAANRGPVAMRSMVDGLSSPT